MLAGADVPDVGDEGELPTACRRCCCPTCPLTLETLQIIAPYALAMALVGLLESLMTAKLVDDITDTHSDKTREARGQGVANIVTGFFGGMGGCAMIGQTMINVKVSGARTRISTFLAGVFLLILVVGLGDVVARDPDGRARRGDDHGLGRDLRLAQRRPRTLRRMPRRETLVMVVTVVATVATHNLAIGVVVGVLVAMVLFARRVAHLTEVSARSSNPRRHDPAVYRVTGELFFASSNDLVYQFDYAGDPDDVVIDLSGSHIWDASTVAALDAITPSTRARARPSRSSASTPPAPSATSASRGRCPRTDPARAPASVLLRTPGGSRPRGASSP